MLAPHPKRAASGVGAGFRLDGFTLIEMMLVLIIIGLIAGVMLPVLTMPFKHDQRIETQREMASIIDAIYGRPDLGEYGFIGGIGGLPPEDTIEGNRALSLLALYQKPSGFPDPLSEVTTLNLGGVPGGWNGPYLRTTSPEPERDGWKTFYRFDFDASDATKWRLRSAGPDRTQGTGDDIVLPDENVWFTSVGQVDIELLLARPLRRPQPFPNDFLAPRDDETSASEQRTPLQPTILLPTSASATRIDCMAGPSLDARCPGVCEVVDANGATDRFALGLAAKPFRISCRGNGTSPGIPYGIHPLKIRFPANTVYEMEDDFVTNVVVNRPQALYRELVSTSRDPNEVVSFLPSGGTLPITVAGGAETVVMDAAPDTRYVRSTADSRVSFVVSGSIRVTNELATCGVELKSTSATFTTGEHPPRVTLRPWGSISGQADLPFTYRYALKVGANLTTEEQKTLIDSIQVVVRGPTAGNGNCVVTSLTGSALRHAQP